MEEELESLKTSSPVSWQQPLVFWRGRRGPVSFQVRSLASLLQVLPLVFSQVLLLAFSQVLPLAS